MSLPTSYSNQATAEFEAARMLALKNQEIEGLRETIGVLLMENDRLTKHIEFIRVELEEAIALL